MDEYVLALVDLKVSGLDEEDCKALRDLLLAHFPVEAED